MFIIIIINRRCCVSRRWYRSSIVSCWLLVSLPCLVGLSLPSTDKNTRSDIDIVCVLSALIVVKFCVSFIEYVCRHCSRKTCAAAQINIKSHFLDFENKTQKNVKKRTFVVSKTTLSSPVFNTQYTITKSYWAKYMNAFWWSGTKLTFYNFLIHCLKKSKKSCFVNLKNT